VSYDSTKLSNFIGQSDDPKKLKDYLLSVDKDLQSLFLTASTFYQFGTGSNYSILTYSSTNYAWFASVGAWSITNALLYGGSGSTYIGLQPGVGIWMGDAAFANAIFSVDPTGQMKAHAGRIGGWYIGTTTLSSTNIVFDSANERIWMGDPLFANAIFSIDSAGNIVAKAGTIGGWCIGASTLSSTNLIFDSINERIESSNFVSGPLGSGWRIGNNVSEFGDIRARGKITCSVFEKEALSSIGGNLLVMDADILDSDMTALDASTLTTIGDTIFATNDILRIKDGVDDEWIKITGSTSAYTFTLNRDKRADYGADSNPIWKKGTAVVNYGVSGEGGILLSSSETYSPYIDFFTHSGSPWTDALVKTRIGNLDGISGASGFGIWAGSGFLADLQIIDTISIATSGAIRSNITGNYPYLEFSSGGLQLKDSDTGGTYGTAVYGTDKYGYGALAWIMNASLGIPWAELKEPNAGASDVASIRLYNRSDNPGGIAEIGDLAVVNGTLKICTGAGTPGTWTSVGSQT